MGSTLLSCYGYDAGYSGARKGGISVGGSLGLQKVTARPSPDREILLYEARYTIRRFLRDGIDSSDHKHWNLRNTKQQGAHGGSGVDRSKQAFAARRNLACGSAGKWDQIQAEIHLKKMGIRVSISNNLKMGGI
ncbi:unnamed protein product [Penicillium bialowiezense]